MMHPEQYPTRPILRATATALIAVLAGLGLAAAGQAQTQLTPPAQRISDRAIQADHQAYERLQGRLQALNQGGRPQRDYHLAKAQCWLDVSFHEYTRNDRSDFPQAALGESERLVVAMEGRAAALPGDTPLVAGAARLRPDLWARADALGRHAGAACAAARRACAEVELVHAGHEHNQQQWRHARPYVQIAEDLLADGEAQAAACLPPPAPPPVVVAPPAPAPVPTPPPPAPPAPPMQREVVLSATVVFSFDRHGSPDMRPYSVVQLDELAARIKRDNLQVRGITLIGHADRLNSTGQADYNQRLSEKRVATVRRHLAALGLTGAVVKADAVGDVQPVTACQARFTSPAQLQECLLPNRRVEVIVETLAR